jgi:hypothetical protein
LGRLRLYPQTLDEAGEACQGQNSSLLRKSVNYNIISFMIEAPGLHSKGSLA